MDTPPAAATVRSFRDHALLLRGRSGLTQRELAALLGVSERAIQKWEAGMSQPSAAHLQSLLALYLVRGLFLAGHEVEEAAALWETLRRSTAHQMAPFDHAWFSALLGTATTPRSDLPAAGEAQRPQERASPAAPFPAGTARQDWDAAPDVATLYGWDAELETLRRWLLAERCRLVAVLAQGGSGKTALATRLAHELAPHFVALCWRSLRNAPPVEEWLAAAIGALTPTPLTLPPDLSARLALLLDLLRAQRGLLVLDNLETVLEPGQAALRYRPGFEGYGQVLQALGESAHAGCLLLTSREEPPEVGPLASERGPVRTLHLRGLGPEEGWALLGEQGVRGTRAAGQALVESYGGNPLALKVVGQTIADLFSGDVTPFLDYATATVGVVFGGIRVLLEQQVGRLSELECALLYWLAIEREPVGVATLVADLGPSVGRAEALEALQTVQRRSLLERGVQGTGFALHPVVLEYATGQLVAGIAEEIAEGRPGLLSRYALVKATAPDFVRCSQERLIAQPLLEHLVATLGSASAVERRLLDLLNDWRAAPEAVQGYGPGNVVNLLRLLRGDLRGLNLSNLAIRHAYLQDVEAQDASLAGAHLSEAVLAGAFTYPTSIALSADGVLLLAGTSTGEVCLWRVTDRTLLLSLQGHSGLIYGVALSGNGALGATGGVDGMVKLWQLQSGRLLATLQGHAGPVYGVALSGDGQVVASGSQDGTVKLWETASGRVLATLHGHVDGVYGMALSEDGELVASGSFDGTVRLWEVASGQLRATLQGHAGGVLGMALSEDSRLVASGSLDGTVKLWEATSGRLLATLQGHSGGVQGVALSGDGQVVASGSQDGTVKLWEATNGRVQATLQGHTGGIQCVALSEDGELVAGGSLDGIVRLWEATSGQLGATL